MVAPAGTTRWEIEDQLLTDRPRRGATVVFYLFVWRITSGRSARERRSRELVTLQGADQQEAETKLAAWIDEHHAAVLTGSQTAARLALHRGNLSRRVRSLIHNRSGHA